MHIDYSNLHHLLNRSFDHCDMAAQTIDEVLYSLDLIISQSKADKNSLGYFASLYRNVTQRVKDEITLGGFEYNEKMEQLDVIFANRYLEAHAAFIQQAPCTAAWQLALEESHRKRLIVLQHLLLGMNAHINLDLGIAAAQVLTDRPLEQYKSDFFKINAILSSMVDEVQDSLAMIWPFMGWFDRVMKRRDEEFADFSMEAARDGAWRVAHTYRNLDTEAKRQAYLQSLDQRVYMIGRKMAYPALPIRWMLKFVTWVERGSISQRIEWLETGG
ncbi:DUF5995 family protein [Pontibacter sp. G13]|uniref:DUF5995 family protein n=1 Tax=Pontibacter sp. G13 TaxID=3074898 RepID=UPI002888FC78|nr:DUF5995 family protein [Pontibacter sp. G13]WNJ20073.1 DUF5995 family protein [Pontibacter sp. G13]